MGLARLLLVEDEAALLELLKKYLERIGYEVTALASAQDALAEFRAQPQRYALVLTDLTLPGIGGEEMLAQMREVNPRLNAIVSSGYPYTPHSPRTTFLQKPFPPKMLAEAIEKMLK